ncbi:ABC transporter permease subunit [Streptomyces apricus]|uniref:ABC transporter permease subunit n=1 Tax=Streptomyces apricus TaxID=1828112 RepID=UPI001CAA8928|nr:ABC transporter permease subunit [Streptomyces apricus]
MTGPGARQGSAGHLGRLPQGLDHAAGVDGANRWKKMWHVTLPSIRPVTVVMLIPAIGWILAVDLDKILRMYTPGVHDTADVVRTYVFRQAFVSEGLPDHSYGAAVGLIQDFTVETYATSSPRRVSASCAPCPTPSPTPRAAGWLAWPGSICSGSRPPWAARSSRCSSLPPPRCFAVLLRANALGYGATAVVALLSLDLWLTRTHGGPLAGPLFAASVAATALVAATLVQLPFVYVHLEAPVPALVRTAWWYALSRPVDTLVILAAWVAASYAMGRYPGLTVFFGVTAVAALTVRLGLRGFAAVRVGSPARTDGARVSGRWRSRRA